MLSIFLFTGIYFTGAGQREKIPDTVTFPLKIRTGIDITGPVIYFTDKNILNAEGYISADLNEKLGVFLGAGYSDYKYSQYNYEYLTKGIFFRAGVDINILKPEVSWVDTGQDSVSVTE